MTIVAWFVQSLTDLICMFPEIDCCCCDFPIRKKPPSGYPLTDIGSDCKVIVSGRRLTSRVQAIQNISVCVEWFVV